MTMRDVNRAVALSGWIVIITVCLMFISTYWYQLTFVGTQPSPELAENAKFAIGFLFGAGAALVKEVMMKPEGV